MWSMPGIAVNDFLEVGREGSHQPKHNYLTGVLAKRESRIGIWMESP